MSFHHTRSPTLPLPLASHSFHLHGTFIPHRKRKRKKKKKEALLWICHCPSLYAVLAMPLGFWWGRQNMVVLRYRRGSSLGCFLTEPQEEKRAFHGKSFWRCRGRLCQRGNFWTQRRYGHMPHWSAVCHHMFQRCRETNKKFKTMDVEDEESRWCLRSKNTVIGSGVHILDTSLRVAQLTKTSLTVMHCMCAVLWLGME